MACIVIPWFADRLLEGTPWQAMAWWIHDHLPYSQLQFFPKLGAFNIPSSTAMLRRYVTPFAMTDFALGPSSIKYK